MKLLKPLFFAKYKPSKTYSYPTWKDISVTIKQKKLSILLQETKETVKGIIVLAHPMKVEGKQYFVEMQHEKLYQSLGFHTILFDFNGFGESENRGFEFDIDVYETIKKAKELYPNLPLFVHGVSFGGSQIILGTLKNENLVNGLILESATSSSLDYYQHRGYKKQFQLLNVYKHFDTKWHRTNTYYSIIKELRNTPILFIYGKKDVITPIWMGEKLFNNANQPKQFEVFDTEHLTTIKEDKVRYKNIIKEFIS